MLEDDKSGTNGELNSAAQCANTHQAGMPHSAKSDFGRSDNPFPAEAQLTVGSTREGADHGGERELRVPQGRHDHAFLHQIPHHERTGIDHLAYRAFAFTTRRQA